MSSAAPLGASSALASRSLAAATARARSTSAPARIVTSLTLFAGTAEGLLRSPDWGRTWERVEGTSAGAKLEGLGAARALVLLDAAGLGRRATGSTCPTTSATRGCSAAGRAASACSCRRATRNRTRPCSPAPASACCARATAARRSSATALGGTAVHRARVAGSGAGRGLRPRACSSAPTKARTLHGPRRGPAGRARARAGAVVVLRGRPRDVRRPPTRGGVFRSADGGRTWSPSGLAGETSATSSGSGRSCTRPATPASTAARTPARSWTPAQRRARAGRRRLLFPLAPDAGLEAFLATDQGVFRTPDGGEHWQPAGVRRAATCSPSATFPPPDPSRMRTKPAAQVKFAKAHGLGNDFILVAAAEAPARAPRPWARAAVRPAPGHRRRRRRAPRADAGRRVVPADQRRRRCPARSRATACAAWPRSPSATAGPRRATW